MRWALAALALISAQAQAQPVTRIVVPFAAGGVQDIVARSFNAELGALLGRTVIVENRAGAGGTIGTGSVAKSAPDGQTLILAAASHTIAGSLYSRLPYDPLKDFTPIAHIGNVDYVLLISAAVPAKSVAEFVSYAKANPGKLNYASAGNGSATHLAMAYFSSLAGIEMVHVPYKATGEAVNEVLAGRAQAVIAANARAAMPRGGRLMIRTAQGPQNCVVLEVTDSGDGMSAATLERARAPLLSRGERGKPGGLGLHIVESCIRAAGGRVELASAPGAGTSVKLFLPSG